MDTLFQVKGRIPPTFPSMHTMHAHLAHALLSHIVQGVENTFQVKAPSPPAYVSLSACPEMGTLFQVKGRIPPVRVPT